MESLRGPGVEALVKSLEAVVAERSRLRTAVAEAESTLARVETELEQRRVDAAAADEAALRRRMLLVGSEAELQRLDGERERWAETRRRPSPPAGTTPLVQGSRAGPSAAGAPTASYEQVLRAHAERVGIVDSQRQSVRLGEQNAEASRTAVVAKADEVERQRSSLADLRRKLADAPTEEALAAQIASALQDSGRETRASRFALDDIPADLLPLYRRSARACPGLSWTVLAAIGSVESGHGWADLPGVHSGANSAGAMGPMQFLAETWAAYGVDGDENGSADVYHPTDAVAGAANYLCASGAGDPARLASALWAYNHADWYVASVLARAAAYGMAGLGPAEVDRGALVDNPNLTLTAEARADLLSPGTDPRVVAALGAAAVDHRIAVSVVRTGHSQYVKGTDRVSNHFEGRAIDIYSVNGESVSTTNTAALGLAVALLTADPSLRPDELGSPWPELGRFPGAFSDADHTGHLHVGWDADDRTSPAIREGNP